jgi:transmembrane sensor
MRPTSDPSRERIAQEAALWWSRLRETGRAAEVEQQFFAWLQISPAHADAYLKVAEKAQTPIQAIVTETSEPGPSRIPVADNPRSVNRWSQWRRTGRLAWIAVVTLGVCMAWRVQLPGRQSAPAEKRLMTTHGQIRAWRLTDGSTVQLASESAAIVYYADTERLIQLESGHAYFHVAKGDPRRFRVLASGASVVATGTEFDVNLDNQNDLVSLIEGTIVVYAKALVPDGEMESDASAARVLTPGEQVSVVHGSVAKPIRVDLPQLQAWRHGRIVADGLSLADVVREFNRYGREPMRIRDVALATKRVSGVFDIQDKTTFIAFLHASFGIELRRVEDGLLLIPPAPVTRSTSAAST